LLDLPDGFRGSCAFDIDAHGTTACGYLVGRDPPRLLPCIWQRSAQSWQCSQLAALQAYNPLLTSAHVVISDDGRRVAASLAVESIDAPLPRYMSHLFAWERAADGVWKRRRLAEQAVHLANINNHGLAVGRVTDQGRRRAFVYEPTRGPLVLAPLPGDVSCQATDVNNQGIVVGWSDDPAGPEGGRQAFLWQNGEQSLLPLPPEVLYSSADTITDDGRVGGWLYWQPTAAAAGRNYAYILRLVPSGDD
jgi:probable HAF family extracellular repeat protein